MARVVSVVHEVPLARAVGQMVLIASFEAVLVIFVGGIFSPLFGKRLMAGMGGMRNAPEETLLIGVVGNVFLGVLVIFIGSLVVAGIMAFRGATFTAQAFPIQTKKPMPIAALVMLALAWVVIAIVPQREQRRFVTHARMVENREYRKSLDYLAARSRADFPASRRLEPTPYEYPVWKHLPKVVRELRPEDPKWVRELYLDYVERTFRHLFIRGEALAWAEMFENIAKLPDGKEWAERNRGNLERKNRFSNLESREEKLAENADRIGNALTNLGMNPKIN